MTSPGIKGGNDPKWRKMAYAMSKNAVSDGRLVDTKKTSCLWQKKSRNVRPFRHVKRGKEGEGPKKEQKPTS